MTRHYYFKFIEENSTDLTITTLNLLRKTALISEDSLKLLVPC